MDNNLKEKLEDMVEVGAETGAPIIVDMISNALIGQVFPGAVNTILSYKQKRTERMMIKAIDELKLQIKEIESKLIDIDDIKKSFIERELLPVVLDNIEKETEEEKIKYIINGFTRSIKSELSEIDLILSYYDILSQLRKIDINIFIDLYKESKKTCNIYVDDVDDTIHTEYEAAEVYIIKKLESLTLISVRKTYNEVEGKIRKPKKRSIDISKLGECLIEFFNMYVEKVDLNE